MYIKILQLSTLSAIMHYIELSRLIQRYFGQNIRMLSSMQKEKCFKTFYSQDMLLEKKIKELFGSNTCHKMVHNKSSS